ncbi:MAG: DMT family transporter [Acetobacterales bacterium]
MIAAGPRRAFTALPVPVQVSLCAAVACALQAVMNGLMRDLSQQWPALEVAFFRLFFGLVFLLPVLLRLGMPALRTTRQGLYLLRGILAAAATALWVYSLQLLPVDKATALNFTVPIWATIGAALILRETVQLRRWTAVGIGLVGSLVIVRPGIGAFDPASVVPLVAAALMGGTMLIVKTLSRTDAPHTIVLYMGLYATPFALALALPVWETPDLEFLLLTFLLGAMGSTGHILFAYAFSLADASYVAPHDFLRLPFGALVGFVLFGELMDFWSWIGAAIIFVSGIYIAQREARAARR